MIFRAFKVFFAVVFMSVLAWSQDYKVPKPYAFITNTYDDHLRAFDLAFSRDQVENWAWIIGASALTYYYDQGIYEASRDLGNQLGLDENAQMQKAFCLHPKACLQVPSDTATSLYYIGDGFTYIVLAGGFMAYGYWSDGNKAVNVGHQILEGIANIAITTQILKRITGRETPMRASVERGKWRFLPGWNTYMSDIPKYDAYPSGHIAAMTSAFTVLSENYPEHRPWIWSIYGVGASLLMFEMMHLGVHWASDYPLGMAIGYYFGKVVAQRHKPKVLVSEQDHGRNFVLTPMVAYGANGLDRYGVQAHFVFN